MGKSSSLPEQMLANYVESLGFNIVRNDRTIIAPKELDIFIPDKNMAIEFNGLYWHSEKFSHKNYHYNKYLSCESKNIRLIQIWEDDWNFKNGIVCNILAQKLGAHQDNAIHILACSIDREIRLREAKDFLKANHIHGWTSSSCYYGLRYNDELVALLCMKKVEDKYFDWDLVRFATSINIRGGFAKLLKAFRQDYPGAIKTLVDLTLSSGDLYTQSGFIMDKFISPSFFYVNPQTGIRSNTETANGLLKVYDAGKLRFVLK